MMKLSKAMTLSILLFAPTMSAVAQETTVQIGEWGQLGSKCKFELKYDYKKPEEKRVNMFCMDSDVIDFIGFYELSENDLMKLQILIAEAIYATR